LHRKSPTHQVQEVIEKKLVEVEWEKRIWRKVDRLQAKMRQPGWYRRSDGGIKAPEPVDKNAKITSKATRLLKTKDRIF
jgi:hypothetical protein